MTQLTQFDEQIREITAVDEASISQHYCSISADLAYWGRLHADAHRDWRIAKLQAKRLGAALKQSKRLEMTAMLGKVTVDQVDAAVDSDPQMIAAENDEVSAEHEKLTLSAVLDALSAKKEMLISLGAHMRAEMGADPSLRTQRS